MEAQGKRAPGVVSRMPTHGGDGYNYGGEWVVSIGRRAIVLGADDEGLAHLIAAAPMLCAALYELPSDADFGTAEDFRNAVADWWEETAQLALVAAGVTP